MVTNNNIYLGETIIILDIWMSTLQQINPVRSCVQHLLDFMLKQVACDSTIVFFMEKDSAQPTLFSENIQNVCEVFQAASHYSG